MHNPTNEEIAIPDSVTVETFGNPWYPEYLLARPIGLKVPFEAQPKTADPGQIYESE